MERRALSPERSADVGIIPRTIVLTAANWPQLQGRYTRGVLIRGSPAYYKSDGCVLFTDAFGAWAFTDGGEASATASEACIAAGDGNLHLHHGTPPHKMTQWMEFNTQHQTWVYNPSIGVQVADPSQTAEHAVVSPDRNLPPANPGAAGAPPTLAGAPTAAASAASGYPLAATTGGAMPASPTVVYAVPAGGGGGGGGGSLPGTPRGGGGGSASVAAPGSPVVHATPFVYGSTVPPGIPVVQAVAVETPATPTAAASAAPPTTVQATPVHYAQPQPPQHQQQQMPVQPHQQQLPPQHVQQPPLQQPTSPPPPPPQQHYLQAQPSNLLPPPSPSQQQQQPPQQPLSPSQQHLAQQQRHLQPHQPLQPSQAAAPLAVAPTTAPAKEVGPSEFLQGLRLRDQKDMEIEVLRRELVELRAEKEYGQPHQQQQQRRVGDPNRPRSSSLLSSSGGGGGGGGGRHRSPPPPAFPSAATKPLGVVTKTQPGVSPAASSVGGGGGESSSGLQSVFLKVSRHDTAPPAFVKMHPRSKLSNVLAAQGMSRYGAKVAALGLELVCGEEVLSLDRTPYDYALRGEQKKPCKLRFRAPETSAAAAAAHNAATTTTPRSQRHHDPSATAAAAAAAPHTPRATYRTTSPRAARGRSAGRANSPGRGGGGSPLRSAAGIRSAREPSPFRSARHGGASPHMVGGVGPDEYFDATNTLTPKAALATSPRPVTERRDPPAGSVAAGSPAWFGVASGVAQNQHHADGGHAAAAATPPPSAAKGDGTFSAASVAARKQARGKAKGRGRSSSDATPKGTPFSKQRPPHDNDLIKSNSPPPPRT